MYYSLPKYCNPWLDRGRFFARVCGVAVLNYVIFNRVVMSPTEVLVFASISNLVAQQRDAIHVVAAVV